MNPIPSGPLISIITVVFNGEMTIGETIKSVLRQPYPHIEYIVIDGGSNDGTVDIIKSFESQIDFWVSEADNGIYHAMNKGIKQANGQGLLFINAGDYLVGDIFGESPTIPSFLRVRYKNFLSVEVESKIRNYRLGIPLSHQGIIFENKKIEYDLRFEIAGDYDYYLKHGYRKPSFLNNGEGYVYYENSGFSNVNHKRRDLEIAQIVSENFGVLWHYLFVIQSKMKIILKRILN